MESSGGVKVDLSKIIDGISVSPEFKEFFSTLGKVVSSEPKPEPKPEPDNVRDSLVDDIVTLREIFDFKPLRVNLYVSADGSIFLDSVFSF